MIPRYTFLHFPNSSLTHSNTSSTPGKPQFLSWGFFSNSESEVEIHIIGLKLALCEGEKPSA